jgi:pimeloyl-ACP methyl ester carboxylesterase
MFVLRHSTAAMALFGYEMLKRAGLEAFSNRPDVQEYVYRALSQIRGREFIEIWDGAVKGLHAVPDYRIMHPLLLTHGDDDRTGDTRKIVPLWAKREPNCTYLVIPNARHFAIFDNADVFNRILIEFLTRWVAVGAGGRLPFASEVRVNGQRL